MDDDMCMESVVPSGQLIGLKFDVLTNEEIEKFSVKVIDTSDDVTCSDLGVPNPSSKCSTCDSYDTKNCDGHFGMIKLPATIYHPYFVSDIVHILNKICPGCKSVRQDVQTKGVGTLSKKRMLTNSQSKGCQYCIPNSSERCSGSKFKFSKDVFDQRSPLITVEVDEKLLKKFQHRSHDGGLPEEFFGSILKDQELKLFLTGKMTLYPYQVFFMLEKLDLEFIEKFVSRRDLLFLSCFPVTPNCNRVMETIHVFSDGARLIFDERTKAYKRLVDFKRQVKEYSLRNSDGDIPHLTDNRVLDCLSVSKLRTKNSTDVAPACNSGSKWMKEVLLGKRTDCSFRLTVVGDPKIALDEIGIPLDISENLLIPEHVNSRNLEKLKMCFNLRLLEDKECYGRCKGHLVSIRSTDKLQIGNIVYRPLEDGDLVFINRPPSVHQHSLIAFSVRVLPVKSVISLNPLCCAPFLGDFDGDCLHGYVPQSITSRVELQALLSLNQQLLNGQNGRNLLSLSQDSLTAAYLMTSSEVFLNRFEMQQLEMLCPRKLQCPAILKAPSLDTSLWTGTQLFSMLLPDLLELGSSSDVALISKGNVLFSSVESGWLRNASNNVFCNMFKHCPSKALEYLSSAQEVLCEWISMRGFSVSLSDVYLSLDLYSRNKMIDEVNCGLQEASDTCRIRQLMGSRGIEHLLKHGQGSHYESYIKGKAGHICHQKRQLAVLNQAAIDTFREISYDLQNVIQKYASKDNSMLAMISAGSKGNLMRLLQQSACLGLQHSPNSLSFQIPEKLSCSQLNQQKMSSLYRTTHDTPDCAERHASYALIRNSFLNGLNPLECFVHALSSRGNFFSENAEVPGTLNRKLMFYMRDLQVAYDGTVRSAYGNQIVQFSYGVAEDISDLDEKSCEFFWERTLGCDAPGGQPVGAWSACAISEAAYGALDQPMNMMEASPLLNLKRVLEFGRKETSGDRTISLFLSKKLRRWNYGFEYAAIEVKNHLERVLLSDVVTTTLIVCNFSEPDNSGTEYSPWISHFHLCKERMKRRRLKLESVMDVLSRKYYSSKENMSKSLPKMKISSSRICSMDDQLDKHGETYCITVVAEDSKEFITLLNTVQDVLIPTLLSTVIKGFLEFKKVDILWNDHKTSRLRKGSSGELFLKVFMSENCGHERFWNVVKSACVQIMDLIDWERSCPDNFYDIFCAFGIDSAWKHFLKVLKFALSDVGRSMHQEHLLILADRLSVTGEFHGLNAKGMKCQRDQISISAPFSQACFSNPSNCFIKAAKEGTADDLFGTLEAVAWGKEAAIGTGGSFDILYCGKEQNLLRPVGVYEALRSHLISREDKIEIEQPFSHAKISKNGRRFCVPDDTKLEGTMNLKYKLNSAPKFRHLVEMYISLREILHKYSMNDYVNEADKSILMKALTYHPQSNAKIGTEPQEIKIGHNPSYPESRCFILLRKDGSLEDFSYRKCVLGAVEQSSPELVPLFRNRLFRRR